MLFRANCALPFSLYSFFLLLFMKFENEYVNLALLALYGTFMKLKCNFLLCKTMSNIHGSIELPYDFESTSKFPMLDFPCR